MAVYLRIIAAAVLAPLGIALINQRASAAAEFTAKAVVENGGFTLAAGIERVFPLFGPVQEKLWAADWEPHVVHPLDRDVAEGMVFTVSGPEGETYWVVTQYDPAAHVVAYANVTPGFVLKRIVVRCRALSPNETEVSVTYAQTALSESGNRYIEGLTPSGYQAKMAHWKQATSYALAHGHPMPTHQ